MNMYWKVTTLLLVLIFSNVLKKFAILVGFFFGCWKNHFFLCYSLRMHTSKAIQYGLHSRVNITNQIEGSLSLLLYYRNRIMNNEKTNCKRSRCSFDGLCMGEICTNSNERINLSKFVQKASASINLATGQNETQILSLDVLTFPYRNVVLRSSHSSSGVGQRRIVVLILAEFSLNRPCCWCCCCCLLLLLERWKACTRMK